MKKHIILLRGVMPTGKNKVPMAHLRQVLSEDGFEGVQTYIQSGNVILKSSLDSQALEERVHQLIKQHIGADLVVIATYASKLQEIIDGNPFKEEDISRIFYTVFAQKPDEHKVIELLKEDFMPEKLAINIDVGAAYMFIPGSAARSKLSNNFLEKKLGISATTRNFNTMTRLISMGAE